MDIQLLLSHLRTESALELLLRGHLWMEATLIDVLEEALPRADLIDLDRLRFGDKLALAQSLALLPPELGESFREVNRLRNRTAHNLSWEYSETDETALIGKLPSEFREAAEYVSTKSFEGLRTFPTMTRCLFIALVIALDSTRNRVIKNREEREKLLREIDAELAKPLPQERA